MKTSIGKSICCGCTPSSSHSENRSADTPVLTGLTKKEEEGPELQQNTILCSSTSCYLIQDFTGEGSFSIVSKGVNLITSQQVALKILKCEGTAKREISILKAVSALDPVKTNVVQFFETFTYKEQSCLVFELLDRNIFQLYKERNYEPLSLCEIRPITQQLLTAFDALEGIGIIHSDLKPSNIMLTNHPSEPFRVKLIDFGLSFTTSERIHGPDIQPLGYRAPEVILGLPISQAIDMWGLGCVLLFLYLAKHPFSIYCMYQSLRGIVDVLGQPGDHVLFAGEFTHKFFKLNRYWDNPKWSLKVPGEYQHTTGIEPITHNVTFRRLDDLITHHPVVQESTELEDQRAFVSLLKCLLHTDPERRITPERALRHAFVTMVHLVDEKDTSYYVIESFKKMLVCQKDDVDEALSSDDEDEEEPKGQEDPAVPHSNDTSSELSVTIVYDGAQAAAEVDAAGSPVVESVVRQEDVRLRRQCCHLMRVHISKSILEMFWQDNKDSV